MKQVEAPFRAFLASTEAEIVKLIEARFSTLHASIEVFEIEWTYRFRGFRVKGFDLNPSRVSPFPLRGFGLNPSQVFQS